MALPLYSSSSLVQRNSALKATTIAFLSTLPRGAEMACWLNDCYEKLFSPLMEICDAMGYARQLRSAIAKTALPWWKSEAQT